MLRRVALVSTDVLEAPGSSETSVLTRATRRNIPEDTTLHSHRRENLKSYIVKLCKIWGNDTSRKVTRSRTDSAIP
jgi:hypothetical protein